MADSWSDVVIVKDYVKKHEDNGYNLKNKDASETNHKILRRVIFKGK